MQGLGPARRLEIHNLGLAVESLDADVVCLQEVRHSNRLEAKRFPHWPELAQADFLAPQGYEAVYRTNAVTRHGEHGNALLSRWPVLNHQHEDMSDHRLEQRGFLHVTLDVHGQMVHVLVVHLGLVKASRGRQVAQLQRFIQREIPASAPLLVAGDFNDWGKRAAGAGAVGLVQLGRKGANLPVAFAFGATGLCVCPRPQAAGSDGAAGAHLVAHVRPFAPDR